MTDHLPECPCIAVGVPSCICDNDEECGPQCRHHCICTALRACEARVFVDRTDHWNAALDAARDAVAALPTKNVNAGSYSQPPPLYVVNREQALAAIDALRGES